MLAETSTKLEELIGKVKYYKDEKIKINSFKVVGKTIIVKTDGRNYTFLPSEIEVFINTLRDFPKDNFLPEVSSKENNLVPTITASEENIQIKKALTDVLKELMDKDKPIKESNVLKSKAVCEIANTMVNIQKVELQMMNAIKRVKN